MSGRLRKQMTQPGIAEFQCILNALHTTLKQPQANGIRKVIVNTDCLDVIHLVTGNKEACNRYRLNSWGRHLVHRYEMLLHDCKIKKDMVEFRHVKGHLHTDTPRHYVNQWCDTAAKEEMGKLLNELRFKTT